MTFRMFINITIHMTRVTQQDLAASVTMWFKL